MSTAVSFVFVGAGTSRKQTRTKRLRLRIPICLAGGRNSHESVHRLFERVNTTLKATVLCNLWCKGLKRDV
jgi:hypothetical protein